MIGPMNGIEPRIGSLYGLNVGASACT